MTLPEAFLRAPLAHRGLHDLSKFRAENTLGAFRAAVEAGYGIELDIQGASDGTAMAFHDYELGRLTGRAGLITDYPPQELAGFDVKGTSDTIPRLDEVLDLVAGQVPVLIEIKDQTRQMGEVDGRVEASVAAALTGYEGPAAVMSFNPSSVETFGKFAPTVPRGLTTGGFGDPEWAPLGKARLDHLSAIADFDRVGACFISHDRKDLGDAAVAELKARGVPVLCWTVRSTEEEATARQVAGNITFEGYLP